MDDYDITGLGDEIESLLTLPPEVIAEINGPFSERVCSKLRNSKPESKERIEAGIAATLKYNPTLNEAKLREYVDKCAPKEGSDWFIWASLGAVAIGLVAYVATRK